MKVFISWSKNRSHAVAKYLVKWLPLFNHNLEPFLSSRDLEKGGLWDQKLSEELKETNFGILCLTQENLREPWILFEAGALFKGSSSNPVCTFLIDINDPSDVEQPLGKFNHTRPIKEDMLKFITTLHKHSASTLPIQLMEETFNRLWDDFEKGFKACVKDNPPNAVVAPRPPEDVNKEILETVRNLTREVGEISRSLPPLSVRGYLPPIQSGVAPALENNAFWGLKELLGNPPPDIKTGLGSLIKPGETIRLG